jgi:hypothetical protein
VDRGFATRGLLNGRYNGVDGPHGRLDGGFGSRVILAIFAVHATTRSGGWRSLRRGRGFRFSRVIQVLFAVPAVTRGRGVNRRRRGLMRSKHRSGRTRMALGAGVRHRRRAGARRKRERGRRARNSNIFQKQRIDPFSKVGTPHHPVARLLPSILKVEYGRRHRDLSLEKRPAIGECNCEAEAKQHLWLR